MPANPLLRRLGFQRPSLIEQATEAADSGFWLALRISPEVSLGSMLTFLDNWARADLAAITDVVAPGEIYQECVANEQRVQWLRRCDRLSNIAHAPSLLPAAAKGAERVCQEINSPIVALDETIPQYFADPIFAAPAEREKSFVRCAKALLTGATSGRIERLSMWTRTPRVLGACRTAARKANAEGCYEFCIPSTDLRMADHLLVEGETVRVWFTLDQAALDRTVAR